MHIEDTHMIADNETSLLLPFFGVIVSPVIPEIKLSRFDIVEAPEEETDVCEHCFGPIAQRVVEPGFGLQIVFIIV